MLKLRHTHLIIISGLIWLAVGTMLLYMGLGFVIQGSQPIRTESHYPLLQTLSSFLGSTEQAALLIVILGLVIGYAKGRYVLGKSAYKGVERIHKLTNPAPLTQLYSLKYYLLLATMIGLGFSMKYLGLPLDVRGLIDIAIGSALINGAMIYFRLCSDDKSKASA